MAGKFINTTQKVTIDSLVEGLKNRLKNPYYIYNDKSGTIVDYYNINSTKSTVDEASNQIYGLIGEESPLRFNKIIDAFIYGIQRVDVNQQINDYGLESDSIEGEAIVLPNTFVPVANDYFRIKYLKDDILFKVINVSIDTLDNGANLYKISYKLSQYDKTDDIMKQVVDQYKMIVNNIGTNFKSVIRSTDFDLIKEIDENLISLKDYFKELFYRNKVQTFIFSINNNNFYDPYMIEFIIRNKLLEGSGDYIYVTHEVTLPRTFSIDYDNSFFRSIELGDKTKLNNKLKSQGVEIDDVNSLMSVRIDPYFSIDYNIIPENIYLTFINNFPEDLINRIESNTRYTSEDLDSYLAWNIVIDYFNDVSFKTNIIEDLEKIVYTASQDQFYYIPVIIFILEKFVKTLMI